MSPIQAPCAVKGVFQTGLKHLSPIHCTGDNYQINQLLGPPPIAKLKRRSQMYPSAPFRGNVTDGNNKALCSAVSVSALGYVHKAGPSDQKISDQIACGKTAVFSAVFFAVVFGISMGLIPAMALIVIFDTVSASRIYNWRGFENHVEKFCGVYTDPQNFHSKERVAENSHNRHLIWTWNERVIPIHSA